MEQREKKKYIPSELKSSSLRMKNQHTQCKVIRPRNKYGKRKRALFCSLYNLCDFELFLLFNVIDYILKFFFSFSRITDCF